MTLISQIYDFIIIFFYSQCGPDTRSYQLVYTIIIINYVFLKSFLPSHISPQILSVYLTSSVCYQQHMTQ